MFLFMSVVSSFHQSNVALTQLQDDVDNADVSWQEEGDS
jgi:hypothetical protein